MPTEISLEQPEQEIAAVRAFNRFYTRKLEVLDQHLLKTPFSLSEARVMFELAHRGDLSAKDIGLELGLDAGYLSRIVQKFDEDGLISRKPLASDRRQYQLGLTAKGRAAFAKLERSSQDHVGLMLGALAGEDRKQLLGAMEMIERLLRAAHTPLPLAILRDPRPGDMGFVVQSHGARYASEYGFDSSFEALVAEIAAKLSPPSTLRANAAGSPISTDGRSARFSWSGATTRSQNSACCWSSRARAARALGNASSPNVSPSRGPAAIAGSRFGRRAF
jgi:DNA-binding MarR family transcriptional regulator